MPVTQDKCPCHTDEMDNFRDAHSQYTAIQLHRFVSTDTLAGPYSGIDAVHYRIVMFITF